MREFTITAGAPPQWIKALVCGMPSSGKTHFASTAPRPLFLSDEAEGGYKTLYSIPADLRWDPKVEPAVWTIQQMPDMPAALARLEGMVASGKPLPWSTIVVDPISIYVDRFLAEMLARNATKDGRQIYGELAAHLRSLVLRFNALPAHVLWLCHVKNDGKEVNGPAIGGQMGDKFPAYCDFKWLTNVTAQPGQPPTWELRTAPFRSWTFLGGRWKLPDPLPPSFKVIAHELGFPERPASPVLPGGYVLPDPVPQQQMVQPQQPPLFQPPMAGQQVQAQGSAIPRVAGR